MWFLSRQQPLFGGARGSSPRMSEFQASKAPQCILEGVLLLLNMAPPIITALGVTMTSSQFLQVGALFCLLHGNVMADCPESHPRGLIQPSFASPYIFRRGWVATSQLRLHSLAGFQLPFWLESSTIHDALIIIEKEFTILKKGRWKIIGKKKKVNRKKLRNRKINKKLFRNEMQSTARKCSYVNGSARFRIKRKWNYYRPCEKDTVKHLPYGAQVHVTENLIKIVLRRHYFLTRHMYLL